MSSDRIKVAGYSQKVTYTTGIEYRNFSPDLVGLQLTDNSNAPLFTMGNFSVTTNFEPKKNKIFTTTSFSNFTTLTDLDLTLESALLLLRDNAGVILNLDKRSLTNYSLFGSFREFSRVALENIILNWPASLYANPLYETLPDYVTYSAYTVENYSYNSLTNQANFKVNTNVLNNKYSINYLSGGNISNSFIETNTLRNLTNNYLSYSVLLDNVEYSLIGFTGSTDILDDYIYISVSGNPFSAISVNSYSTYHIKPNLLKENEFFNSLPNFEYYLLNRLVYPKYTADFNFTIKSDYGDVLYVDRTITWPVSDGYNLDYDTQEYEQYAIELLDIATDFDLTTSNLMVRFLVTESITDFDTTAVHLDPLDQDDTGQKMNKTLTIYGVEYDKINNYIQGIKFANTVSYDKNNNTPDIYLKNIARTLGWDLISSVLENNLLQNYVTPTQSTYSGQSVGLTLVEADIELWRRIILNTPWLWKSKGTRKAIEFLFKFIGTPLGLISFNEYIYLAENKIDISLFETVLGLNGYSTNISLYPVSFSGYPNPLPNTSDLYFQSNGLWYRETGGDNAGIDITTGNNPHAGPYDGGYKYINQFRTLIPNFSAVTISSETVTTTSTNLFSNYNKGTITGYEGDTYVDITTENGVDFSECFVVTPSIIDDPQHRQEISNCGCDVEGVLNSLSICIDKNTIYTRPKTCQDDIANITTQDPEGYYIFDFYQYNIDGTIYTINGIPQLYTTMFINKECCNFNGSIPYYYNQIPSIAGGSTVENSGYICCRATNTCGCLVACKWILAEERWIEPNPLGAVFSPKYLVFIDELGNKRLTSQDGCNCIKDYTLPVQITDPYTNEVGYGCQLTQLGLSDIDLQNSVIYNTYLARTNGEVGCGETLPPPINPKVFAVVINEDGQIESTVNNLNYYSITTPNISGVFNASNTSLSGSPVGYMDVKEYSQTTTPNLGDTVRMTIQKDLILPANLTFDTSVGNSMSYFLSNTVYDSTNILSQTGNWNRLTVNSDTTKYYADFPYISVGTPTHIYMIWDFRKTRGKIGGGGTNNYTITYTNNIQDQIIQVLIGNNGSSPSTTIYNDGYFTDPVTGTDPNLPMTNARVMLYVPNKSIFYATCNGVAGTINGNYVSWSQMNGSLEIVFTTGDIVQQQLGVKLQNVQLSQNGASICSVGITDVFVSQFDLVNVMANGTLPMDVTLYTNSSLTTPVTGYNFVRYNYMTSYLNSVNGVVGTQYNIQC